ncbi:MAG: alpha-mannosidase [Planctomycetes bacterium GWF2_41_51]|nr:MAG: alpha-mannosidase [Planctomycetes bacterium GWF2_41_51]
MACQYIQAVEQKKQNFDLTKDKVLYTVGYAHLDTQWRWDYVTTINEYLKNTLHDNFDLFEKYPGYVFNFTGSRRYEMMKEYYPAEYEKVKEYISQGRWFVSGSSVDEGDVLVPSPESVIRQVLYGNDYFRKEFGVESYDYMLPDCFGFPDTFPSVLAHCGILGFSSQKLTWNSAKGIPFNIGMWEGPDGNAIMAVFRPGDYVGSIKEQPNANSYWADRIEENGQKYGIFAEYHYYGVGDRGGSVRPPDANNYTAAAANSDGKYKVYLTSSDRFYRDISNEQKQKLPRYRGDLLLIEHSAGSLTSAAYMKRWNRKNEQLADSAERAAVAADWVGGAAYPIDKINAGWKLVLGSQMHDILPGTCVSSAYDYSYNDEVIALNTFASVLENSAGAIVNTMDTTAKGKSLVVYNPLSIERTEVVEATLKYDYNTPKYVEVIGPDGSPTPSQIIKSGDNYISIIFAANVPSIGFSVFDVRPVDKQIMYDTEIEVKENVLQNKDLIVEIDKNGDIAQIYDKKAKRQLLEKPVRLAFLNEKPKEWPAWNMDWNDRKKPPIGYVSGPAKITIVENGPVRVSLRIDRQTRNSFFTQYVRLTSDDRSAIVEVKNEIDWQSKGVCLKAEMLLTVSNSVATYTFGMGTIERTNNDPKKYEVPSHQWFDLTDSDGSYGVSVIDDCKYGSDKPADNILRLTLLYTPGTRGKYDDQGWQDWGRHEFIYGIYGHTADWRSAKSQWQGRRLNQPMVTFESDAASRGPAGKKISMVNIDTDQIEIKAFKKAENSNSYIIRVQEVMGKPAANAALSIGSGIAKAMQVDGQEREIKSVTLNDGKIVLNMEANGIRSFAVQLKPAKYKTFRPKCEIVKLDYNADVISSDSNRTDGKMDSAGKTFPAEQFPQKINRDSIDFELGSAEDGKYNALACNGKTIVLPKGNYDVVYLLAAADEDTKAVFKLDDEEINIEIQGWTGFVGSYDRRIWDSAFEKADFKGQAKVIGLEPGFIKRDNIAWFCSHRHSPLQNDAYNYCYIFKYRLNLNGSKNLVLPDNPKIKIFAITIADIANDDISPAAPLYDDFSNRQPLVLRN